jgi:hypothetical protein
MENVMQTESSLYCGVARSLFYTALLRFVVIALVAGYTPALRAQCDSTFQAISDSDYVWGAFDEDGNPDSTDVESLALAGPEYTFYTASDSSKLRFQIGEFMLNRRKLFLAHWCLGRTVNWNDSTNLPTHEWTPQQMRERTATREFLVNPGDTVQFYRAVWWIDRLHNAVLASRYINPDPVSYSVHVELASGTKIATIDTMYFAATTPSGRPCIVSWYPMLSRVRYIIPASIDSATTIRLRVSMYHHGSSPAPFVRNDIYDGMESALHLNDPTWRAWNDSVLAAIDCASQQSCDISVASATSPSRLIVTLSTPTAIDDIQVVRTNGVVVWSSAVPMSSNPQDIVLDSGLYIVVASTNGVVTCTRKAIVP